MGAPRSRESFGHPGHPGNQRLFAALGTTAFVATTSPAAIEEAEQILRAELGAIDRACSRFRPESEISQVHMAQGYPVVISPLLADAISAALGAAAMTDGAVDPTIGRSLVALGYDRDFDEVVPDSAPLNAQPRRAPGWRSVQLDVDSRVLRAPAGALLDLGATAKAFAADRAANRIAKTTGSGVLVNLGGDISIAGPPPMEGWPVGLAMGCAISPAEADVVVALRSGGLASSGTAVRTWRRGGRQLHHIIDPRTGDSAVTCWRLVTVAAATCTQANAASTAAIVWGHEAPGRLSALGLPCRLVGNDGTVVTLAGWPAEPQGAHRPGGAA